jgi:hypothetical protein
MIGTIISIAVLAVAVVATLAEYWQEITCWIKACIQAVKAFVEGILIGFKVFIERLDNGLKEISKHYSKDGNQWFETTKTRKISTDEVPSDILAQAQYYRETDITDEYNEQLKLAQ